MNHCSNLYFLSTIACKLAECLEENELEILSADLNTLGEMLVSVLARQATRCDVPDTITTDISPSEHAHDSV